MKLKHKNINIIQYADFRDSITLTNTNHTPVNLTNYIAIGQLKRFYDSTLNIPLVCSIPSPLLGIVNFGLSATSSSNLDSQSSNHNNSYTYDIILKNTITNIVTRIQTGIAYITPGTTDLLNSVIVDADNTPATLQQLITFINTP